MYPTPCCDIQTPPIARKAKPSVGFRVERACFRLPTKRAGRPWVGAALYLAGRSNFSCAPNSTTMAPSTPNTPAKRNVLAIPMLAARIAPAASPRLIPSTCAASIQPTTIAICRGGVEAEISANAAVPGPARKPRTRMITNTAIGLWKNGISRNPPEEAIIARTTIGLRPMRSASIPQRGAEIANPKP